MRTIPFITQFLMMIMLALLEELFCILDIIFILLFLLLLGTFWGWRLGEFDIVFYYLVGEDDALVWTADPGGFGLYLDWWHVELFQYFLLETRSDVRASYVWQTKEKAGSHLGGERKNYLGEDGAKSILIRERLELCLFVTIFVLLVAKIFNFFLNKTKEACKLIFKLTFREHR